MSQVEKMGKGPFDIPDMPRSPKRTK